MELFTPQMAADPLFKQRLSETLSTKIQSLHCNKEEPFSFNNQDRIGKIRLPILTYLICKPDTILDSNVVQLNGEDFVTIEFEKGDLLSEKLYRLKYTVDCEFNTGLQESAPILYITTAKFFIRSYRLSAE